MGVRALLADTTPLSNPAFRRLWSANIVTVIGAQLTVVAVPAQIYAITGSSAYVGLTGLFGLVPLVVFGLWGGALADVFDRRSILRVTTVDEVPDGQFRVDSFFDVFAELSIDGGPFVPGPVRQADLVPEPGTFIPAFLGIACAAVSLRRTRRRSS